MSQLGLNKGKSHVLRTATVKIMGNAMESKLKRFELTLIGRLMNPEVQNMESLLVNFPKIWKLEDRVRGTDLGSGRFLFNMASEEDLIGVLRNEPYFFYGWMVSLVRWEPSFAPSYPTAISFWVKPLEIPLHVWDEEVLRVIGDALGLVRKVDVDTGSVFVTIDGFNPLFFKTEIPFDSGDVIEIGLSYDKLANFCSTCFRLTHSADVCPEGANFHRITEGKPKGKSSYAEVVSKQKHEDNNWEVQRKPPAKRTLNFKDEESRYGFPYKYVGPSRKLSIREGHQHSGMWANRFQHTNSRDMNTKRFKSTKGKKKLSGGTRPGILVKGVKVGPSTWPKPLYVSKHLGETSHSNQEIDGKGAGAGTSTVSDRLTDGAMTDGVMTLNSIKENPITGTATNTVSDHLVDDVVPFNTDKDDLLGEYMEDLMGEEDHTLEDGEFDEDYAFAADQVNSHEEDISVLHEKTIVEDGQGDIVEGNHGSHGGNQDKLKGFSAIPKPPTSK